MNFFALRAMGVDLDLLPEQARRAWGPSETDEARYRALFAAPRPPRPDAPVSIMGEGLAAGVDGAAAAAEVRDVVPTAFGECSPTYLSVGGVAELIHHSIPAVRLVAILRDPVERAISNHAHNLKIGIETERDLESALLADDARGVHGDYVRPGLYAELLGPYLDVFGRDQILLLSHDDLANDPRGLMSRLFEHIGVDAGAPIEPEHRFKTEHCPVSDSVRHALQERFQQDTRRLVEQIGFEGAARWSTYSA